MELTRRHLIKATLAVAAISAMPELVRASLPSTASRSLQFYNIHTGESLKTTYWEKGTYIADALNDINHVLRDFRTGAIQPMDPNLLDLLHRIHGTLGSAKPFEIISGYRSPQTNAMLHARSSGVASKSMHMQGKAIDIRLTDRSLSSLRDVALDMEQGGVGYYPGSNFVHVDTGRVRRW